MAVDAALASANVPLCCRQFVLTTFDIIGTGKTHVIAAAFTYGREDLIPGLFGELVARLDEQFPGKVATLRYYLQRHIELDGDEHGELGRRMVASLCGDNPRLWKEATDAAILALQTRLALWDGINAALTSRL
jgi:pyrroloquinoline quinone (PQQ) biosynthesis protein C